MGKKGYSSVTSILFLTKVWWDTAWKMKTGIRIEIGSVLKETETEVKHHDIAARKWKKTLA